MIRDGWIDLAHCEQRRQTVEADVCVVGAGAAGIYLAVELARRGLSVVLVEAGARRCVDGQSIGLDSLLEDSPYPGATAGRFFGLGGTTAHWGGQLVPHSQHDLREGQAPNSVWAHVVDVVSAHAPAVLRKLNYTRAVDFDASAGPLVRQTAGALDTGGLDVQATLALPFRHKNFVGLLHGGSRGSGGSEATRVFFNAVACSWLVEAGAGGEAKVAGMTAVSPSGNELHVTAGRFVLAAGAIESARMLLEMDASGSNQTIRPTAAVGCYLADHLSVAIADVVPEDRDSSVRLFAPRFSGAWMRSFRLLESSPPPDAPRAFAHFIFSISNPGFELAREVFGAVQGRRMPAVTVGKITAGTSDLLRLAYHRFVRASLYVPPGAPVHLQLDMEQNPVRSNRIRLTEELDRYGRRKASIHWQVTDIDMANMTTTARRLLAKWGDIGCRMPRLQPRALGGDGTKPHDAYHPVGTCRMGRDAEAVVDFNLKVVGVQNLWVASTGVLPSAGTANPTFTLLCLTHHLADHLQELQ